MALALSRAAGETLVLAFGGLRATLELVSSHPARSQWRLSLPLLGPIEISIETKNGRAKIAISAPRLVHIRRGELADDQKKLPSDLIPQ
jgi:hypothetical protein